MLDCLSCFYFPGAAMTRVRAYTVCFNYDVCYKTSGGTLNLIKTHLLSLSLCLK